MSKEKQIEEMAKDLYGHSIDTEEDCDFVAKLLYNAGYRKQSEGRWVRNQNRSAYEAEYFCSECLADGNNQGDEPFCWNCGAKMKGGAE